MKTVQQGRKKGGKNGKGWVRQVRETIGKCFAGENEVQTRHYLRADAEEY